MGHICFPGTPLAANNQPITLCHPRVPQKNVTHQPVATSNQSTHSHLRQLANPPSSVIVKRIIITMIFVRLLGTSRWITQSECHRPHRTHHEKNLFSPLFPCSSTCTPPHPHSWQVSRKQPPPSIFTKLYGDFLLPRLSLLHLKFLHMTPVPLPVTVLFIIFIILTLNNRPPST